MPTSRFQCFLFHTLLFIIQMNFPWKKEPGFQDLDDGVADLTLESSSFLDAKRLLTGLICMEYEIEINRFLHRIAPEKCSSKFISRSATALSFLSCFVLFHIFKWFISISHSYMHWKDSCSILRLAQSTKIPSLLIWMRLKKSKKVCSIRRSPICRQIFV